MSSLPRSPLMVSSPLHLVPSAFSAAKDAAGNVDINKLQQLKEMGEALSDETSKKDD